jgi:hypothetical protein
MVFSILTMSGAVEAALIVEATVSSIGGGAFHYDFSITNSGPEDVVLVTLNAPLGDPLIDPSLVFPAGFFASYDSGLGFVDFLEDTDLFGAGTTKSGFGFDSGSGPSGFFDVFTALTTQGDTLIGQVQQNVIPEPGTVALLALGLGVFGLMVVRRKYKLSSVS